MEGGDVYDEQKRGDGGSLRDPDRDGSEEARGPLERQAAGAVPDERADPLDQVWADPFLRSRERSEADSTLSKPPFISRKRVETLYRRRWKDSRYDLG